MLSSPAISELSVESATLGLLAEWLASYFDGNTHDVGRNAAVPFPLASIRFQQSSAPQPLEGLCITCVWSLPAKTNKYWDSGHPVTAGGTNPAERIEAAKAEADLFFFVRAQGATTATGNPKRQCQRGADLLYGLLNNTKETLALSDKGIHKLRPVPARIISEGFGSRKDDLSYALRLVQCRMRLRYAVHSQ